MRTLCRRDLELLVRLMVEKTPVKPAALGAATNTPHTLHLRKLATHGLVRALKRKGCDRWPGKARQRLSFVYQITDAGLLTVLELCQKPGMKIREKHFVEFSMQRAA